MDFIPGKYSKVVLYKLKNNTSPTFTYSSPAVFHPPLPAPLTLLLTNICCPLASKFVV